VSGGELTGSWRLVSWDVRSANGEREQPFGADPNGLLIYSADGYMQVSIAPRAPAADGGGDYLNYGGPFRIEGDTVVHEVELSANKRFRDTEQLRSFDLDGKRLILAAQTGDRRHVLEWRRA
jgi:hypothetical protein